MFYVGVIHFWPHVISLCGMQVPRSTAGATKANVTDTVSVIPIFFISFICPNMYFNQFRKMPISFRRLYKYILTQIHSGTKLRPMECLQKSPETREGPLSSFFLFAAWNSNVISKSPLGPWGWGWWSNRTPKAWGSDHYRASVQPWIAKTHSLF